MKSFIALFLMFAVLSANAFEWHVYCETANGMTGNQQLTNAFIQAQSGDTITIHKGTYNLATEELMFRYEYLDETKNEIVQDATQGTCLLSTVDNLTVQGDPSVSRDEIILSGRGSANANSSGQHQIMRLSGSNCIVKHLTFSKGLAQFSKVLYQNGKLVTTDKWAWRRGAGLYQMSSSVCRDCVFVDGYAGHGGGAGGGSYYDCLFLRNSGNGGQYTGALYNAAGVHGCRFEDNKRGAIRSTNGVVSNCVFVANLHNSGDGIFYNQGGLVIDCIFTNNSINSVFTGTTLPTGLSKCRLYGQHKIENFGNLISECTFVRTAHTSFGVLSNCSRVEDCRFKSILGFESGALEAPEGGNASVISNCVLSRCHLSGFNVRYGWVFFDVPHADNCLIEGNNIWGYTKGGIFGYSNGKAANIVNCTIVSNKCNNSFYNEGNGIVTFSNSLFFNNKVGGMSWNKFDVQYREIYGHDTIRMENCVYKAGVKNDESDVRVDFVGSGSINWFDNWNVTPKFLKDVFPDEEHEHPYALHRRSPCINAGANGSWTAQDLDLAGNKRVNDIVDIGCYENWDKIPGMTLLVR